MTLEKVDAIGACGTEEGYTSELVWMVQGDTLTIAAMDGGNGVMANYTDETPAPWNAYASQIKKSFSALALPISARTLLLN